MSQPEAARSCAAVILAAGASSRMGRPKALLEVGGETFLDRLAGAFLEAGCSVYVVVGEHAGIIVPNIRRAGEVTFVRNPDPSRGQLSSLQCGLRAIAADAEAIFFTPVDAPGILPETIRVLKEMLDGMDFAIPIYEGKRGHPVLMRASCAAEFLSAAEDTGARDILRARRMVTRFVEVLDPAIVLDIDDEETYERWRGAVSSDPGVGEQ